MTADEAKWDDMIWGLKMQVLKPVMELLQTGYLQKFIGILPKIADAIAKIFKTVSPIIEASVDTMVGMIPSFQEIIKTLTEGFSGFAKGFKDVLGVATTDTKNQTSDNKPSASTQFWASALKTLFGIYTAIRLGNLLYRATSGIYSGFKTVQAGLSIFFGTGSKKKVMNSTLSDLQKVIEQANLRSIHTPTTPSQMSMASPFMMLLPLLLGGLGMKIMGWVSKKVLGDHQYSDLKDPEQVFLDKASVFGNVFTTALQKIGLVGGYAGGLALKNLSVTKDFSKTKSAFQGGQEAFASVKYARLQKATTVGFEGAEGAMLFNRLHEAEMATKTAKMGKNLAGFSKVISKVGFGLGTAMDIYGLSTAETKAEKWSAAASLITQGIGTAVGLGLGALGGAAGTFYIGGAGGVAGAIAGAGAGYEVGSLASLPISTVAGLIGGYLDKEETREKLKTHAIFKEFGEGGAFADYGNRAINKGTFDSEIEQKFAEAFKDIEVGNHDMQDKILGAIVKDQIDAKYWFGSNAKRGDFYQNERKVSPELQNIEKESGGMWKFDTKINKDLQENLRTQSGFHDEQKNLKEMREARMGIIEVAKQDFLISQWKKVLQTGDEELIEKEKKRLTTQGRLNDAQLKAAEDMHTGVKEMIKLQEQAQGVGGKIIGAIMQAFSTNNFSQIETLIKIGFRKIGRALITAIKDSPFASLIEKKLEIDINKVSKDFEDNGKEGLRGQIETLKEQIRSTKGGDDILKKREFQDIKDGIANSESLENQIVNLSIALMKQTQASNKNTKSVDGLNNQVKKNTEAINKEETSVAQTEQGIKYNNWHEIKNSTEKAS